MGLLETFPTIVSTNLRGPLGHLAITYGKGKVSLVLLPSPTGYIGSHFCLHLGH